MRFLIHADAVPEMTGDGLVPQEYEYDRIAEMFVPILARFGTVHVIRDWPGEIDSVNEACRQSGESCLFIFFGPPHKIPEGLRCPAVAAFAWGYSTIVDSAWWGNPRNDWRVALRACKGAIVFSSYAAEVVRTAMGGSFPVAAVLPPVWDHCASVYSPGAAWNAEARSEIRGHGVLVDSVTAGFSADLLLSPVRPLPKPDKGWIAEYIEEIEELWSERYRRLAARFGYDVSRKSEKTPAPVQDFAVDLQGVTYTSVLNPSIETKAWRQMLTAFCWAFRETANATLVLNMTSDDFYAYREDLFVVLSRLAPFQCRVVVMHAALSDGAYRNLIAATTFYVNTSECEGLCVPMMEFMAYGKPVIAPAHTAMADYVNDATAFAIGSSRQLSKWPHDPREVLRTETYRLDWETIVAAFRESYLVATTDMQRYAKMGAAAQSQIRQIASQNDVEEQFRSFLATAIFSNENVTPG
jgi:glycosyltransferase involved in cell wall biosynthesis